MTMKKEISMKKFRIIDGYSDAVGIELKFLFFEGGIDLRKWK